MTDLPATQDPAIVPAPPSFDPSTAVYTPSEVATYGRNAIERAQKDGLRALSINIPVIEDYFAPVRPGQVAGIVGQTSHGKSLLLRYIEHRAAKQIIEERREEVIVHVSLEESVEEQAFGEVVRFTNEESSGRLAYGKVNNWEGFLKASMELGTVPIFRVGDSMERSDNIPNLYLSNIIAAIDYIKKDHKIAMIAVDYLQALPIDPNLRRLDYESQRRIQVREDAYRLRAMASRFGCPMWVAVQAKQHLSSQDYTQQGTKPMLIPNIYDINESADVPQRFDRLLGVWLPVRSYNAGTLLDVGEGVDQIKVVDNLFFIKVIKQRGGLPAGKTYVCDIDWHDNSILPRNYHA